MAFSSRKFIDSFLRFGVHTPEVPSGRHTPPPPVLLASVIRTVFGETKFIGIDLLRKEGFLHGFKSFLNKGDRVTGWSLCLALVWALFHCIIGSRHNLPNGM